MKYSRKAVRMKATAIPELRFEDQRLTSYGGLVVIQRFFQIILLKSRLRACFRHFAPGNVYGRATIFMQLIVHFLLGFRELRDTAHYRDDPMKYLGSELNGTVDLKSIVAAILRREKTMGAGGYLFECEPGM